MLSPRARATTCFVQSAAWAAFAGLVLAFLGLGCGKTDTPAPASGSAAGSNATPARTIGVAFETLQTEGWIAAWERIQEECQKKNIRLLEAVADGDANRQFEQVRNFINRKVDGIIIAPKDAKTVIPMIKACNTAGIPCVLYNRPADPTDAKHTVIAPDNVSITKDTVDYLIALAKKSGKKQKAIILLGDLGDINALGRRDGFELAVKGQEAFIDVVARIPTDWNQEKALAGVQSAFQANPDIGLVFTSSDFMFPSIKSVLSNLGRWKKHQESGHVILGGFDGDATAYQLMVDGYVDATGVQDLLWESEMAVKTIIDIKAGQPAPARLDDKGFAITQANLKELENRMWGALVARKRK